MHLYSGEVRGDGFTLGDQCNDLQRRQALVGKNAQVLPQELGRGIDLPGSDQVEKRAILIERDGVDRQPEIDQRLVHRR